MTLVKTQDLPPDRRYVFGYHPHGIIGVGAIGSFATEGEYADLIEEPTLSFGLIEAVRKSPLTLCDDNCSATGFSKLFPGLRPHLLTVSRHVLRALSDSR
jgi:2-acylglycerol O-acyltransferase 2